MAASFKTALAAGLSLALLAGPAVADGFDGSTALSDGQLNANRAFGTADCSTDSCTASGTNVESGGTEVADGGTEVEGDHNEAGENQVVVQDGATLDFHNNLQGGAMSGVQGVGTAVQNNGNNATINVRTTVTLNGNGM